jgi:hypothetical protein
VALVEKAETNGRYVYRVRPAEEIARALALAYDPFSADDLARRLSGLEVAARAVEAGDMAKAMIATLLLKLPPLSADTMAKLVRDPTLKKSKSLPQAGAVAGRHGRAIHRCRRLLGAARQKAHVLGQQSNGARKLKIAKRTQIRDGSRLRH